MPAASKEMVELYGLLRGVLVTDRPGQDGMPVDRLASVCSFKPRLAKEEDQLRAAITLDADLETNEYFLQAEQASDVQTANSIITSYGTSAMTALANNFGAGLSASAGTPKVAGTGSAGVAESSSSSSGDAVRSRESATRILQSKTKELSKTRYYFAPKLAINIDPYQLQASPEFGLSWSEIAYLLCQQKGGTDCTKFQVEENVYGVEFADDSKPDEARATTVVSFVATNFATTATLSASVLPTFEGAIRAAFEGTLTVEDGEQIVVEVSYPSALVVEDIFSNVQVVVKIPPKPYPGAKPTTTRTRPEWFRQWFARGWMKSSILTQLAIPPILKNAPVSVGDTDLARLSVTTEDTPPPANTSLVMVSNTSEVVTDAQVDQKVRELIYKFGSHICPDAVLGGYWRIDAKYSSLETKDRVEVDNIVTRAIQSAETDSRAFNAAAGVAGVSTKGAGAAGAAAEGGESESSSSSSDETQGDAQESEQASKTTKLEIEQSWKGGAPGTQPADWRRSLDEAFSSNWKIIDHVFPKCVGIWRFVKDADTQRKLCETWLEIYLEEGPTAHVTKRIEESARKKACESTLYMNAIRQEAQELVRLDSEASTRLSRELCESNQAYPHFRFTPTRLRSPNATMAAVQGIRLGLDQETVTVFEFQPRPVDGIGWEIPLGTSINVRFASAQSVTDFSFLLTPDKYGQDPIEFKLEATQDKTHGPWRTLLKFTLDERAQVLSDAPAAGESTTFREAWSRWIPVRGAAEGYFWDNTDQTCKEKQCLCTAEDGTNQPGTKGAGMLSLELQVGAQGQIIF
ncbi:unnamed protein product [Symbiodinium natans]|uniref:MACPF domain-containing protein n=1 Tax=Symbiodinium natans TaxID=878477 RepID=A0A812GIL7_9DINO|nr:unnamed protein product [Symbiodinium natans]